MEKNVKRNVQYLIVTMGEGLWEDAELGVGQRRRGRQKEATNMGQTEKTKKGLEINSYKQLSFLFIECFLCPKHSAKAPDLTLTSHLMQIL